MPSQSIRNWRDVSRNLTIVASMADRFLDLSPEDRRALLRAPESDRLLAYSGWQLAETIRQAKDIVHLLETAEAAWKQAKKKDPRPTKRKSARFGVRIGLNRLHRDNADCPGLASDRVIPASDARN